MTDPKQHWENVYRNKTPVEVSWFQAEPVISLEFIQNCASDSNTAIIDVGGGASRLVDCLLDRGYKNIAVLDVSAQALEHARTRLGARADQVEWFVEDITLFRPTRKFDCWHDRAVFHFLTHSTDRELYLQTMEQALVPGADVIIATFATGGPKKCSGLDVEQYDEDKIKRTLGDRYALQEVKHETHVTPGETTQAFNYFYFRKIE